MAKQSSFAARIEHHWYGSQSSAIGNFWLMPLWVIFVVISTLRRIWYQIFPARDAGVPVLVVGNIAIGGTGKTPLITYLAKRAGELDLRVGIVSRGYGGQSNDYPLNVTAETSVNESGDEPKLLTRTGCPVVVDPKRSRAVQFLKNDVDLVLSDDGLQHYAMARAGEIVVSDMTRGFGNGWQLPIGPLREPKARASKADLCLVNGADFIVQPVVLVNAKTGEHAKLDTFSNKSVHAIAGIGNPARFFTTLKTLGYMVEEHAFADHHAFVKKDITFSDVLPVVMTEKDWVKCREFCDDNVWYLQVDAQPTAETAQKIDELLIRLGNHNHG